MKVKAGHQVVWKNNFIENKSGGGLYVQEIEKVGPNIVRPLTLEDISPNKWYLMRANGQGQDYRPVYLSEHADYKDIKAFIKNNMLYEKLH